MRERERERDRDRERERETDRDRERQRKKERAIVLPLGNIYNAEAGMGRIKLKFPPVCPLYRYFRTGKYQYIAETCAHLVYFISVLGLEAEVSKPYIPTLDSIGLKER